jgi:hypothetical protein
VTPNENIPHMLKDHGLWEANDGNHVMVSNPRVMISTVAPMTRANGHVQETQSANEKLDPKHGEATH